MQIENHSLHCLSMKRCEYRAVVVRRGEQSDCVGDQRDNLIKREETPSSRILILFTSRPVGCNGQHDPVRFALFETTNI